MRWERADISPITGALRPGASVTVRNGDVITTEDLPVEPSLPFPDQGNAVGFSRGHLSYYTINAWQGQTLAWLQRNDASIRGEGERRLAVWRDRDRGLLAKAKNHQLISMSPEEEKAYDDAVAQTVGYARLDAPLRWGVLRTPRDKPDEPVVNGREGFAKPLPLP